jgi:hypothetical protein
MANAWLVTRLVHDRFLPNPVRLIIHQRYTYSPGTDGIVKITNKKKKTETNTSKDRHENLESRPSSHKADATLSTAVEIASLYV